MHIDSPSPSHFPENYFTRNAVLRTLLIMICTIGGLAGFAHAESPALEAGTARVTALSGQVSILRNASPWTISEGDLVRSKQTIVTGEDGKAELVTADGSRFTMSGKTQILLRNEALNERDLLDLQTGRVRVFTLHPGKKNLHRVLTQSAAISFRQAEFVVAVNEEDGSTRVQVNEGEVKVQHALLPRGDAIAIRADDAISVYKDAPIEGRGAGSMSFLGSAIRALLDTLTVVVPSGRFYGHGGEYVHSWQKEAAQH